MKTLKCPLCFVWVLAFLLPAIAVAWSQRPTSPGTGWYWCYDNTESGPPFVERVEIAPLPTWSEIAGLPGTAKTAPYTDRPFAYPLPDSFWYYGKWYAPGDTLYFSPDGWLSFDSTIAVSGAPAPPPVMPFPVVSTPNGLISPLWADYVPTGGAEPSIRNNRYYRYDEETKTLIFEWCWVAGALNSANRYNFQARLQLGGQELMDIYGTGGNLYSRHFICFLYDSCSNGWTADNGAAGLENQNGTQGIWYQGNIADGLVIRAGFKRVFKHDAGISLVQLDPALPDSGNYEPGTPITVTAMLVNYGEKAESNIPVRCDIIDWTGVDTIVYTTIQYADSLTSWLSSPLEPCSTSISFPVWTFNPTTFSPMNKWELLCRSQLDFDTCPQNDYYTIRYGFPGVKEQPKAGEGFSFEIARFAPDVFSVNYTLPRACHVSLALYNASGSLVKRLLDKVEDAGRHSLSLTNTSDLSVRLPCGVYLVRMEAGGYKDSKKVVILR